MPSWYKKHLGRRWLAVRRRALERDGWRCMDCGRAKGRFEVHHLTALKNDGPPFVLDNLTSLCSACHLARHRPPHTAVEQRWYNMLDSLLCKRTKEGKE